MSRYIAYLKKMMLFALLFFTFTQNVNAACPTGSLGDGTSGNPCQITTVAQLQAINTDATSRGHSYKLMNDINLSSVTWTPISTFTGVFDGQGHTISNLNINDISKNYQGLFGQIQSATIKYLNVSGTIIANYKVGGLVGYAASSVISNCSSSVNVTIRDYGTSKGYTAGSLVGELALSSKIEYSYATGSVTGYGTPAYENVGGLVGQSNGGIIDHCYATGNVISRSSQAGGLVGNYSSPYLTNSYATGNVTIENTTHAKAGGLIGSCGTGNSSSYIRNCYSTGNVVIPNGGNTGTYKGAGGFIGSLEAGGGTTLEIQNSYATGDVDDKNSEYTGGFIGFYYNPNNFVIPTNNYWDTETTGLSLAVGSSSSQISGTTGKTTNEMKITSTFSGWSIVGSEAVYPTLFMGPASTPWKMANGVSYNANEATSGTAPNGHINGNIASNGNLERTGYVFMGWNTAMDGSGIDYLLLPQ